MQVRCYDYALGYLSRYQKTMQQTQQQLKKKGYEDGEIVTTLEAMQELGLLNDRKYAEQYLHSEVVRKGKPLFVIQQKLYQKGVDRDITALLCDEMEEELVEGQKQKIQKEIEKLYHTGLENIDIKKKLQSRGYEWKLVEEIIERKISNSI